MLLAWTMEVVVMPLLRVMSTAKVLPMMQMVRTARMGQTVTVVAVMVAILREVTARTPMPVVAVAIAGTLLRVTFHLKVTLIMSRPHP